MVFGLLPALRASRSDPWTALKNAAGAIAGSGGSLFLRKGLVTVQVALSFLLLFGAGLFVRSLQNLRSTDAGVAFDNLVTFQLSPALSGYTSERGSQFYRELLQNLRSTPGVKSAGQSAVSILSGDEWDSTMSVEGHKPGDGEDMQAFMNALSPDYFKTMQISLLEGRDFRESDQQNQFDDAAPLQHRVAIVNQKFGRHFFRDTSPIGKRLGFGGGPKKDRARVSAAKCSFRAGAMAQAHSTSEPPPRLTKPTRSYVTKSVALIRQCLSTV
jgi:hypothetical protein